MPSRRVGPHGVRRSAGARREGRCHALRGPGSRASRPTKPAERSEALVEVLTTSLEHEPAADLERAWLDEVRQRVDRFDAGETEAIDWAEARRRIRDKYGFE
ncbi:MAG: hypothetical protein EVA89_28425 [Sandaracinaceae bacterium]|nr:MAG: hypothetical protein EVA89_28425 [Sandaracinaceae bacterium]